VFTARSLCNFRDSPAPASAGLKAYGYARSERTIRQQVIARSSSPCIVGVRACKAAVSLFKAKAQDFIT
jgi:hypothetical protein